MSYVRDKSSTTDCIFILNNIIQQILHNNNKMYCAFIDYKKAFPSVDHVYLWQKLLDIGINGKVLAIIKNLYKDAKSCVKYKGEMSEFFSCGVGVRQGENLSPLLFSVFLNDLEAFLKQNNEGIQVKL